jgi:CHASE3 domain sensor protein
MSEANGSFKLDCPMVQHWTRINSAMDRSEAARNTLQEMSSKVEQLNRLPDIAAEIRNLNRNNTILLIILGALLIINAVANAGVNFKGGALGATAEITQGK